MLFALFATPAYARKNTGSTRESEVKAEKKDLVMTVGSQSTVDLKFKPCKNRDECIKVANVGKVKPLYNEELNQLIFIPIGKGETTVTIRDEQARIRLILKVLISDNNLVRRQAELKELLRDIEGVEIKVMADKIVIDGEVVVIGDLNRLYNVVSDPAYKDLVMNLVTVSPVGMQIMAERIQNEIGKEHIKVRPFNGLFLVEGQVDSMAEADQVLNIAHGMLQGFVIPTFQSDVRTPVEVIRAKSKDPIVARITIAPPKPKPPDKIIRITVDFVELSKDYLRNFGFVWSPSLDTGGSIQFGQSSTGGVTSQGSGSLSGTIGNLFPKLSSAQDAGYARILEESIMIVKQGKTAHFGRELDVPIQTVNDKGQPTFNVVKIGPNIKVIPVVVGSSEDIDMTIEFGYKGLAGKQGSAPIILNHNYSSDVIVKSGESAAIVNALSNTISTAFNKDPPGGSVPANPLFELLRSKAFQKQKSQFVVFLTPQIIESSSGGTEDIKHKYGLKRKP